MGSSVELNRLIVHPTHWSAALFGNFPRQRYCSMHQCDEFCAGRVVLESCTSEGEMSHRRRADGTAEALQSGLDRRTVGARSRHEPRCVRNDEAGRAVTGYPGEWWWLSMAASSSLERGTCRGTACGGECTCDAGLLIEACMSVAHVLFEHSGEAARVVPVSGLARSSLRSARSDWRVQVLSGHSSIGLAAPLL